MSLEMKMDNYLRKSDKRRIELKTCIYTYLNVVYTKPVVLKMYFLFHIFIYVTSVSDCGIQWVSVCGQGAWLKYSSFIWRLKLENI